MSAGAGWVLSYLHAQPLFVSTSVKELPSIPTALGC